MLASLDARFWNLSLEGGWFETVPVHLQSALMKAFKEYEALASTKRQVERDSARSNDIAGHEK